MSELRIAAQLYTVREFMKTPKDTVNTLKRVKEIGYDAVQVSGTGYIDREKAEEVQTSLLNSFDADWRECFQQYLANPVLEPWKYPVPQNERVEKARLLHEFRTSKTDTK